LPAVDPPKRTATDWCLTTLHTVWDEWRAAVAKGILSDDSSGEREKEIRIEVANLLRREVKKLVPEAERAQERSARP
jgi:hypothetical protein